MHNEVCITFPKRCAQLEQLLQAPNFPRGDLAKLRRLDHTAPFIPSLLRILISIDIDIVQLVPDTMMRWAAVVKFLALTSSIQTTNPIPPFGTALVQVKISESRLIKLLAARGEQFRTLALRIARHLTSKNQPAQWGTLCKLILVEEKNEILAEELRLRMAKDYYKQKSATAEREN